MDIVIRDELKYIFSNVNEWLKFAEIKHGALLALNVALISATSNLVKNADILPFSSKIWSWPLIFFVSSCLFSIWSFMPTMSFKVVKSNDKTETNIYFYGDIKNFSLNDYSKLLAQKLSLQTTFEFTVHEKDLLSEIIINSKITYRKYVLFNAAGICCILGLVIFVIVLIAYLFV